MHLDGNPAGLSIVGGQDLLRLGDGFLVLRIGRVEIGRRIGPLLPQLTDALQIEFG